MNGNFNPIFVNSTLQILEKRCLTLLFEGYNAIKLNANITIDWEEEDISKALILYWNTSKKRGLWNIGIIPEHRIYNDDKMPAKKAARIDFRFSSWTRNQECTYFAEAKNLIETDTLKTGRKTKTSAISLQKRYIKTGIGNYFSGRYPSNGCLLGYVLQGNTQNIIDSINRHLSNNGRQSEQLDFDCLEGYYVSKHNELFIKHLMFDFT